MCQNPHGLPDRYEAVSGLLPGRGWKQHIQGGGEGGGPIPEVDTKMSQIDPGLRLQMQGIILNGGNATGVFVEIIWHEFLMKKWILE